MKRRLLLAIAAAAVCTSGFAQTWGAATSTNPSNGRVIIFRYVDTFAPSFNRSSQPDRVILAWKYPSDTGMPVLKERQRMDAMEDALGPVLEREGFATLALVSTGENLREWTYYVKSEAEFMVRLNQALAGQPAFPIEVHATADSQWLMYEKFKAWMGKGK